MSGEKVLLVDDEPHIVELAQMYLEREGYAVCSARDGLAALAAVEREAPDLVVLDLMLPGLDGWEVCRRIRAAGDLPIIMLTARDETIDKIVGLELGADAYLTKPFDPRELVAWVKSVLRRSAAQGIAAQETAVPERVTIGAAQLTVDPLSREVTVAGAAVSLRAKEFDLLLAMLEHRGAVLSREQLLDMVWGFDFYGQTRTVDVHIAHLRNKLRGSGVEIETVWGIGYKLVVP
ncbi:MAG: response regulator transcription factor [Anaerolineae bacterium]|nr:response regulator transcription factor [Anaerolineae bacterium]